MKACHWMFLFCLALGLLLSACARYPSIPETETLQLPTPPPGPSVGPIVSPGPGVASGLSEDYRIGPEDVLQVKVWDHEDLTREVPVSRNGEFTFPLIGAVKAAGRTCSELEKELVKRLGAGYVVNPQVTVAVKEYKSQRVHVVGEVRLPGTIPLTGSTSVVEVLTKAGGPTDKAGTELLIIRLKDHARASGPATLEEAKAGELIRLDLRGIQMGDVSHNIRLQHGDTVIVPKAKFFFVLGEVKSPGQFPFDDGITVLKAITIAGGLTDKAAGRRIRIVREKGGVRVEMAGGVNDLLQANDIVVVPESFF